MSTDTDSYEQAKLAIATKKTWGGIKPMDWPESPAKLKNNWPKPHKMRNSILINNASVEGWFVDCYYKRSPNAGIPNKVGFSFVVDKMRIIGIDDGKPSTHFNLVGHGLPYYHKHASHPHLHTPAQDGVYGYASPIDPAPASGLWTIFLAESNIDGAPDFASPESTQTELPL